MTLSFYGRSNVHPGSLHAVPVEVVQVRGVRLYNKVERWVFQCACERLIFEVVAVLDVQVQELSITHVSDVNVESAWIPHEVEL